MGKTKALTVPAKHRTNRTSPRARKKFLEALADVPNITYAAGIAGTSRSTIYKWEKEDPQFAVDMAEAQALAIGKLEESGLRRARDGYVRRPIFNREGEHIGNDIEYSDSIWGKMMAAHHPSYRAKEEGAGRAAVTINIATEAKVEVLEVFSELGILDAEFGEVAELAAKSGGTE